MNEDQLVGSTVLSRFSYGALDRKLPGPAVEISRLATRHPWRRNLLVIIAHLVWGITLSEVAQKLIDNE